jgi:hypothetical protein
MPATDPYRSPDGEAVPSVCVSVNRRRGRKQRQPMYRQYFGSAHAAVEAFRDEVESRTDLSRAVSTCRHATVGFEGDASLLACITDSRLWHNSTRQHCLLARCHVNGRVLVMIDIPDVSYQSTDKPARPSRSPIGSRDIGEDSVIHIDDK